MYFCTLGFCTLGWCKQQSCNASIIDLPKGHIYILHCVTKTTKNLPETINLVTDKALTSACATLLSMDYFDKCCLEKAAKAGLSNFCGLGPHHRGWHTMGAMPAGDHSLPSPCRWAGRSPHHGIIHAEKGPPTMAPLTSTPMGSLGTEGCGVPPCTILWVGGAPLAPAAPEVMRGEVAASRSPRATH